MSDSTNDAQEALKAPEPRQTDRSAWPSVLTFFWEIIKTVVTVFVLALIIRVYLIQPFIVDGLSMYPRFQTNDYLLVDKLSYRLGNPQRGDIVVFHYPKDPALNYVKRVIGLPGETVHIENGQVKIINSDNPFGIKLEESYINGADSTYINVNTPDAIEFKVPDGNYFVMGDNRRASSDSREWGYLAKDEIIGRVIVQVYPVQNFSIVKHARYEKL